MNNTQPKIDTAYVNACTAHMTREQLVEFLARTLENEVKLRRELDEIRGIIR